MKYELPPPAYSHQKPPPGPGQAAPYPGQPNPQPGTCNPAFVQFPGPNVNCHQPGQQVVNGQVVGPQFGQQFEQQQFTVVPTTTPKCDERKMLSVGCPIAACIFCWPLGIGSLVFYLRAKKSQGNCFDYSHFICHFVVKW